MLHPAPCDLKEDLFFLDPFLDGIIHVFLQFWVYTAENFDEILFQFTRADCDVWRDICSFVEIVHEDGMSKFTWEGEEGCWLSSVVVVGGRL